MTSELNIQLSSFSLMTNRTNMGLVALTLLAVTMTTGNLAFAQDLNEGVVDPDSKLYDKYTSQWWQWAVSIAEPNNPILDETGEDCAVNQSGNVWFLAGSPAGIAERDCTIPVGKQILFPIINIQGSETSAENAEAFNEIITILMDTVTDLQVTVDGVPLENLDQYRFKDSTAYAIDCQAPVGGCEPGLTHGVQEGYYIMLTPLPPGEHTIEFSGTIDFFGTLVTTGATYDITVAN